MYCVGVVLGLRLSSFWKNLPMGALLGTVHALRLFVVVTPDREAEASGHGAALLQNNKKVHLLI